MVSDTFTWKIKQFSILEKVKFYYSDEFLIGGTNWKLQIAPGGDGDGWGNSLAIYLCLSDGTIPGSKTNVFTKARLRVLDQSNSKHAEGQLKNWFSGSDPTLGFQTFLPLKDLTRDASKGYLVKDCLIVQVEFEEVRRA